jgi:hypothetical protein
MLRADKAHDSTGSGASSRRTMASNLHLRQYPERLRISALRPLRGPVRKPLLAFLLVALFTGLLAASQLASFRSDEAPKRAIFLTEALGSPQGAAPLVRKPSRSQTVRLHRNGFTYMHGTDLARRERCRRDRVEASRERCHTHDRVRLGNDPRSAEPDGTVPHRRETPRTEDVDLEPRRRQDPRPELEG